MPTVVYGYFAALTVAPAIRDALDAGAIGFTSSLSTGHKLPEPDNRPVASVHASWDELSQLVCTMGATGRGIFELSREREVR